MKWKIYHNLLYQIDFAYQWATNILLTHMETILLKVFANMLFACKGINCYLKLQIIQMVIIIITVFLDLAHHLVFWKEHNI
jgi:hypothetical protein